MSKANKNKTVSSKYLKTFIDISYDYFIVLEKWKVLRYKVHKKIRNGTY
jgi:hypothetical protein